MKWRDETPGDFVFTVKGPRFATNRRVLAEAGESISRFFASGVLELGDKLGPINWQFATTKKFDREDFSRFLTVAEAIGDREIRHAVEVRHDSFRDGEFVELAREHDVAIVVAGQCEFPLIADITTSFVYVRIMGASDAQRSDMRPPPSTNGRCARAHGPPAVRRRTCRTLAPTPKAGKSRDVFLFAISGFKERNPAAAAMALIERVG